MTKKVSTERPKGRQKGNKLKLKKDTLKDLEAPSEKVKGGAVGRETDMRTCTCWGC